VNTVPGSVFTTIHFHHNLWTGQYAIVLHYTRLERLVMDKQSNFWPIHKLRRKWNVVNTAAEEQQSEEKIGSTAGKLNQKIDIEKLTAFSEFSQLNTYSIGRLLQFWLKSKMLFSNQNFLLFCNLFVRKFVTFIPRTYNIVWQVIDTHSTFQSAVASIKIINLYYCREQHICMQSCNIQSSGL